MKFPFYSALIVRSSFLVFIFCQLCTAQQNVRTIFLVRSAEKISALPIAPLSPAGQARAECLAHTLKDAGVKQIFVTEDKAPQQTAAPLASALKVTPASMAARDISALVRNLSYGAAGNALVVAESDALPVIIARLQAGTIKPIAADEYDSLFAVTLVEGTGTPAVVLHYCYSPSSHVPAQRSIPTHPAPKKSPLNKS